MCEWEAVICGFVSWAGVDYQRGDAMPEAEVLWMQEVGARAPAIESSTLLG